MPTLFRLLIKLLIFAAIVAGGLFAAGVFLEPQPREIVDPIRDFKVPR